MKIGRRTSGERSTKPHRAARDGARFSDRSVRRDLVLLAGSQGDPCSRFVGNGGAG